MEVPGKYIIHHIYQLSKQVSREYARHHVADRNVVSGEHTGQVYVKVSLTLGFIREFTIQVSEEHAG